MLHKTRPRPVNPSNMVCRIELVYQSVRHSWSTSALVTKEFRSSPPLATLFMMTTHTCLFKYSFQIDQLLLLSWYSDCIKHSFCCCSIVAWDDRFDTNQFFRQSLLKNDFSVYTVNIRPVAPPPSSQPSAERRTSISREQRGQHQFSLSLKASQRPAKSSIAMGLGWVTQ